MDTTETIRKRYDRAAAFYDRVENMLEGKMKVWRAMIWRQVGSRVLEVGVGTGRNIPYYPDDAEITAIDFSPKMLEKARDKAKLFGKKVDLRIMDVQKLEFPDEYFDTVVTTCVFCSVPDPVTGLREMKRVCKTDGQIIMLEHVRSRNPFMGGIMDLLNPLTVRISGANINRNTVENLQKAGLQVTVEQNLMMDIVKHLNCKR